jgi:hypothetical protein
MVLSYVFLALKVMLRSSLLFEFRFDIIMKRSELSRSALSKDTGLFLLCNMVAVAEDFAGS